MTQEEKVFELWELVGDRWRLPIKVCWEDGFAVIRLADIPMISAQRKVALDTLEPFKNSEGEFVAPEEVLKKHARKSKFTNPEDIVEWRRIVAPAAHFKHHPQINEFLDAFVAKGSCPSRPVMSALYSMLLAHMLDWVINKQKPLDLIFCTLYPLQLRRNWKEIVLGKAAHRNEYKLTEVNEYREDVKRDLCDGSLLGLTPDKQLAMWTIECVASKQWVKLTDAFERRRKAKLRHDGYWPEVAEQMKRQLQYAFEAYRSYVGSLSAKVAALPECRRKRGDGNKFRRLATANGDPAWVVPLVLPSEEESRQSETVASTDASLPAMSSVQPETNDVRDTRENVPT